VIRHLKARYGLADLLIRSPYETNRISDPSIAYRRAGAVMIEVRFPPDPILAARQPLLLAAAASITASLTALILVAFSVLAREPNRTSGVDSTQLMQTFQTSIRTLRGRESELVQLREREKARADELALITATLVRSLSSGFLSLDEDGLVVDLNEEARLLLRVQEGSHAGKTVMAVLGDTPFARRVTMALEARVALQREEVGSEQSDSLIGLTTVPLLDDQGRYFGMLALFTDLLPVRRLERRVRDMQSLADLGELSAGIAHEFRNSLSTILGYLHLAQRTASGDAGDRLARAEQEAKQLNGAVESLLAFVRPMPLDLRSVDLLELSRDVIAQLEPVSQGARFEVRGETAIVKGDSTLLRRVLENVLRNAVDAIRQKECAGKVEVHVAAKPTPSLTITDDGIGLDPSQATKLFLPFHSTKQSGFGVGLALARKIVLLHGGTIDLNGAPGQGATARITFPSELEPSLHLVH
jgi:signal transduction histidine kinase